MVADASSQISALAFLDDEAKKQTGLFKGMFVVFGLVALGFPLGSIFGGIPWWVSGLMIVCGGGLAAVSLKLVLSGGTSLLLNHLRAHANDPVASARVWATVQRGLRSLHIECTTEAGATLREMLLLTSTGKTNEDLEARTLASLKAVVPHVEIL